MRNLAHTLHLDYYDCLLELTLLFALLQVCLQHERRLEATGTERELRLLRLSSHVFSSTFLKVSLRNAIAMEGRMAMIQKNTRTFIAINMNALAT